MASSQPDLSLKAKAVMNARILAVTQEVSGRDLAVLFLTGSCSGLPVIDHRGRLVGMVSEVDLLKAALAGKDLHTIKTADVMSPTPLCVEDDQTIEDVMKIMIDNHIIRLPVIRNERLVGVISRADVLGHLIETSLINVYGA